MRIELRDEFRRRIGRIEVDAALRPTRVAVIEKPPSTLGSHRAAVGSRFSALGLGESHSNDVPVESRQLKADSQPAGPKEVFLNWDTAQDDAGQLRRCVACGCPDLFREKAFPQVTAFVVVLAFVGAVIGILRLATDIPVLITMSVVLVLDIAILIFSRRRLVCYQCRTSYHDIPIARYHRPWDRAMAERYPAVAEPQAPAVVDGAGSAAAGANATSTTTNRAASENESARENPLAPHKGFFAS